MNANGPAVCFSRRNPTTAPGRILLPRPEYSGGPKSCHGARRVWRVFLPSLSLRSPLRAEALAKALGEGGRVQILLSSGAIAVQV